ncbi:uncharacterized protein LOC144068551 isoform X2 [Stigmatopora argus]
MAVRRGAAGSCSQDLVALGRRCLISITADCQRTCNVPEDISRPPRSQWMTAQQDAEEVLAAVMEFRAQDAVPIVISPRNVLAIGRAIGPSMQLDESGKSVFTVLWRDVAAELREVKNCVICYAGREREVGLHRSVEGCGRRIEGGEELRHLLRWTRAGSRSSPFCGGMWPPN